MVLEWLVQTHDVDLLWKSLPTYMISQGVYLLAGLVTFVHAFKKGGRWPYFWFATIIHGLYTDNFWHFVLPEYDNFWHSLTPITLLGERLPLHIIFLYPAFIYHAAYAVYRLNIPFYAEPFAVGLLTVLIDIPYDIVSVKFVHWTWHDTDPNIYDRHYWVPWNSYYFHATFAASLYFCFHYSRKLLSPKLKQWQASNTKTEWISMIIASFLGMPGGILMFVPFYHPMHDRLGIHSEVTFFILFALFGFFTIRGLLDRKDEVIEKLNYMDYLMLIQLALHYLIYWCFVVFYDPQTHYSYGPHEPVGPCDKYSTLTTPILQELKKRTFLCIDDYDEKYFDFHCSQKPQFGATHYTICGTPFENRAEYVVVISAICVTAAGIFSAIYFNTQRKYVRNAANKNK